MSALDEPVAAIVPFVRRALDERGRVEALGDRTGNVDGSVTVAWGAARSASDRLGAR